MTQENQGPLTDYAINEVSRLYKQAFGTVPENLGGRLAWDNKAQFQRAYAEIVYATPAIEPQVANLQALKRTPFGKARIRAKYDQFEITTEGFDSIVIGDPPRVQSVNAQIMVNARKGNQ